MILSVSMCTIYMLKLPSANKQFTIARLAFIIFRDVSSNVQNSNSKSSSASGI